MIDNLVGNYIPDTENLNINTVKEKLLELPGTKTFDTQFNAIPAVIMERKRTEKDERRHVLITRLFSFCYAIERHF